MIYSEPLFNQISRFLLSIGFGFVICFLYIGVVFLRSVISEKKVAIFLQDIIFGFSATLLSFFFMVIYNNGEVRWNLVMGEMLGFGALYLTFGKHIMAFFIKTATLLRKIIHLILTPFIIYVRAFAVGFNNLKNTIKRKAVSVKKKGNKENSEEKTEKIKWKKKSKKIRRKQENINKTPLKNQNKSV